MSLENWADISSIKHLLAPSANSQAICYVMTYSEKAGGTVVRAHALQQEDCGFDPPVVSDGPSVMDFTCSCTRDLLPKSKNM